MKTTRYKGFESGYTYEFIQDNKIFSIAFGGNLDLYWTLKINKEYKDYNEMIKEIYDTFTITKDDNPLYYLLKTLINDIKSSQVYTPSPKYTLNEREEVVILPPTQEEIERTNEYNKELKDRESYKRIIKEEAIEWHSDEEPYEIADVLRITEQDDVIVLEFYRPELTGDKYGMRFPGTVTIRFRNSGSYYHPFNFIFMRMYNKLQEFDPESVEKEQQTREESPYQLKRGHHENN